MSVRSLCRDGALVFLTALVLVALPALALAAFASSARARALMPLGFGRLRPGSPTAAAIALDNSRVALVPLGLALVAHQGRGLRRASDLALSGLLAFNAAELGAALAGYGLRALVALLPHAPIEFAAYAAAGAAYLEGRRRPLRAAELALFAAVCALLLVAAALLETYVQLRLAP